MCYVIIFFYSVYYSLQIAFEMMSVMAVMTNCALVALNANVQKVVPDYGEGVIILLFVLAEVG